MTATIERPPSPDLDRDRGDPVVVGIDPGAVHTALAVRRGSECLDATTVSRYALTDPDSDVEYVRRVLDQLDAFIEEHRPDAVHLESLSWPSAYLNGARVEDWNRLKVGSQVARTAITFGAILAAVDGVKLIRPDKHDSQWHPETLGRTRPAHFTRSDHPKGDRSHERAAFAIAGASR